MLHFDKASGGASAPLAAPLLPLPIDALNGQSVQVVEPEADRVSKSAYSKASLGTFGKREMRDELSRQVHLVSVIVNLLLFGSKLYVWLSSGALVVLAALVDSTVDLLAQAILLVTNRMATSARTEPSQQVLYPAGRSRAEPVGVIACALLMAMASAQVIRDSGVCLWDYWTTQTTHHVQMTVSDIAVLGSTILMKFVLYRWCASKFEETQNVTVEAVAQDHLNDVLSNSAAMVAALMTLLAASLWLADPIGAILISVYIIYSWFCTGMEQLDFLVGRSAEPEFLDTVREMAETRKSKRELELSRGPIV